MTKEQEDGTKAICKMLHLEFYSKYINLGRSESDNVTELPNFIDIYGESLQLPQLKFHLDYNWQFKVIDWIESTSKYCFYSIVSSVGFETTGYKSESLIEISTMDRKKGIFELLVRYANKYNNKEI